MNIEKLDIIIVNFNSTVYLLNCIDSIYTNLNDLKTNIVVIDNNSDENVDSITNNYPDVILIKNSSNIGFAAAINQGIEVGESEFILLLNPDSYLTSNLCLPMIDYAVNHPDVAIIGPKIIDQDGSIQGSARTFPNTLTAIFGRTSPLTKYFPNNPISKANIITIGKDSDTPIEVDWVSGACMLVRRKAIDDVGLLDERYFIYWEDADWCRRMWSKGWKVIYFPEVSLYHFVGKSSISRPLRSIYYFHRSSYLYFDKHTRFPYGAFKPFAAGLLFFRCLLVVLINLLTQASSTAKKVERTLEKTSVLHTITRLIVGGAQENTILTAELLDNHIWEVDVISGPQTGPEGSLIEHAIKRGVNLSIDSHLVREIHPIKDFLSFIKTIGFITKKKYKIVHTHSSKAGILGRWAAWLARVPVIVHTVHGWGFHEYQQPMIQFLYKLLERLTLPITDKLIVVTKLDIDKGMQAGIGSAENYELIRSGIEIDRFSKPIRPWQTVRKEFGIPLDAIVIGTVTRLSPQKAPHVFIKAAQIVTEKYPNIYFLVVGDGPLRKDVEQLIHDYRLEKRVCLAGLRRDVPDLLAAFDIFALSSLWEGLPRVLPQAMANGRPVIASAIDGNQEIITDRINGLLFPPGDHAAMAKTLMELIENPPLAEELALTAKETVLEFDVNHMVDKIADLYLKQLKKHNIGFRLEANQVMPLLNKME